FYDSEIKSCTNNLKNISFISSINIKDFVGPITEDVFLGKNIEDNLLRSCLKNKYCTKRKITI
ncbi:MAG: hypothetical protein U0K87_03375, partial [Ruminococcus sp.]|nr:hypothetical protein [Ruminococcus sp.]